MAYTRGGGYVFLTRSGERESVCMPLPTGKVVVKRNNALD